MVIGVVCFLIWSLARVVRSRSYDDRHRDGALRLSVH